VSRPLAQPRNRLTTAVANSLPPLRTMPTGRNRGGGTMSGMKILDLLHVMVAQAFYKWAMREINPMHPDVPKIMLRQQQLAEKHRRIWA
jgi:hypothetical protein